jgi:hypothetical protein
MYREGHRQRMISVFLPPRVNSVSLTRHRRLAKKVKRNHEAALNVSTHRV